MVIEYTGVVMRQKLADIKEVPPVPPHLHPDHADLTQPAHKQYALRGPAPAPHQGRCGVRTARS
jgi:hypothetical protein